MPILWLGPADDDPQVDRGSSPWRLDGEADATPTSVVPSMWDLLAVACFVLLVWITQPKWGPTVADGIKLAAGSARELAQLAKSVF